MTSGSGLHGQVHAHFKLFTGEANTDEAVGRVFGSRRSRTRHA